jgi:hypothetical protein
LLLPPGFADSGLPPQPAHPAGVTLKPAPLGPPAPLAVPTAIASPTPIPVSYQPAQPTLPPNSIAWDAESKEADAKEGEVAVKFAFWLTNVCSSDVLINSVRTSCGCTVAKLPAQPWRLPPGTNGPIEVTMHISGKSGSIAKAVTVDSNAGIKNLLVKVNIPVTQMARTGGPQMDRLRNMQMSMQNRQAPLQGECAKCHVEPARDKMGKELYAAACAICHNSEHRATTVPDLQANKQPMTADYWRLFITLGNPAKPGSMMPAFAREHAGFLTQEQITSLVNYLVSDFPKEQKIVYREPAAQTARPASVNTNAPSASAAPPPVSVPGGVSVFPVNAIK